MIGKAIYSASWVVAWPGTKAWAMYDTAKNPGRVLLVLVMIVFWVPGIIAALTNPDGFLWLAAEKRRKVKK